MYGSLGIFAAYPFGHILYNEFNISPENDYIQFSNSFLLYFMMGFCYLGGLYIYAIRVPEKWYPGKFCIWGSSH